MKRILLQVAFIMATMVCTQFASAQDFDIPRTVRVFIEKENYVYGMGCSKDFNTADEMALQSLAKSVYSKVISNRFTTEDNREGGGHSFHYSDDRVLTIMEIKGSKIFSMEENGMFYVVRFYDKEKYVKEKLKKYHEYMNNAEIGLRSGLSFGDNLYLGYAYLAYKTIDDEAFKHLSDSAVYLLNAAKKSIKTMYTNMCLNTSISTEYGRMLEGHYEVRNNQSNKIQDFEYKTPDSKKWNRTYTGSKRFEYFEPTIFSTEGKKRVELLRIKKEDRKYVRFRPCYEIWSENYNSLIILDVDEEFRFGRL